MNSSPFLYNENKQLMQVGTCIQCLRDCRSYLLVHELVGGTTHQDQSCRQNTEVFGFIAKGSQQVSGWKFLHINHETSVSSDQLCRSTGDGGWGLTAVSQAEPKSTSSTALATADYVRGRFRSRTIPDPGSARASD